MEDKDLTASVKEEKEVTERGTLTTEATDEQETAVTAEGVLENCPQIDAVSEENHAPAPMTKRQQFIQILKFTGFSISAGVIQFVTTGALSTWTNLIPYWIAYLLGLILSVVWNFTFNRKFTFKAANNVPLAMGLVILYYCAFTPVSTFGADAIVDGWKSAAGESWVDDYEMVITASMMILNFVTEFIWDKLVVFNAKVTDKILNLFKKNK